MKHLMLHFSRGGTHGSSDRLGAVAWTENDLTYYKMAAQVRGRPGGRSPGLCLCGAKAARYD